MIPPRFSPDVIRSLEGGSDPSTVIRSGDVQAQLECVTCDPSGRICIIYSKMYTETAHFVISCLGWLV